MLEVLCISGGKKLLGKVKVAGAKNSALPLLIACLLTKEPCCLHNVPDLEDIAVLIRLLKSLGAQASFDNNTVNICTPKIIRAEAPYNLVKALRASFWVFGPLVARCGEAQVSLPGGDAIGSRPVDLHLKGLSSLGLDISLKHGVVYGRVPGRLRGAKIKLDFPSVGATHHILLTAAMIPEETVIVGAAREPEISDLCFLLKQLGAEIDGIGSAELRIVGSRKLKGADFSVIGDRIEAATYLLAAAVTGGDVSVSGIEVDAIGATLAVLREAGCLITADNDAVSLKGPARLKSVSFMTGPFPEVATDVQPLLMAAMTKADGVSEITETVFESRFGHVAEYRRFGADITIDGRKAIVKGVRQLSAAPVEAMDIRAAAGEVIMALMAEGTTQISDIYHLDRGYDSLVDKLRTLGGSIARLPAIEEKELVLGC